MTYSMDQHRVMILTKDLFNVLNIQQLLEDQIDFLSFLMKKVDRDRGVGTAKDAQDGNRTRAASALAHSDEMCSFTLFGYINVNHSFLLKNITSTAKLK